MNRGQAKKLLKDYSGNTWLIGKLTEGLSHQESLLQLEFPANCLNWVLGHILTRRNSALELLGATPIWNADILSLYSSGSQPITDANSARRFEDLLMDLEQSQKLLETALSTISPQAIEAEVETEFGIKPVWEHIDGLIWHETFHAGQLDFLKALAHAKRETDR
jgi:hypothetical protein